MEPKIIEFLTKIINEHSYSNAIESTIKWHTKNLSETTTQKELEHYQLIFLKSLRVLYQIELNKLLSNTTTNPTQNPNDIFKDFGSFITSYSLWLNNEKIIDFQSSLTILEDIIETYPIYGIEGIYSIMENFLKLKTQEEIDKSRFIILKITNTMLKRLSSNLDTKLRGRVQMLLSTIFSLCDKSGVNLKGSYNTNNSNAWNNIQSDTKIPNVRFYKQFWLLHRYLTNPTLLFPAYTTQDNSSEVIELLQDNDYNDNDDPMQAESSIIDVNMTNNATTTNNPVNIQLSKMDIFLGNIKRIMNYFQLNPIAMISIKKKVTNCVMSAPKYLTHPALFELQLNDMEFRRTILIQFIICLKAFLRPVSSIQKICFVFNEETIGKINDLIKMCMGMIDNKQCDDNEDNDIKNIFDNEIYWENWKENKCQEYEQKCEDSIKSAFLNAKGSNSNNKRMTLQSKIKIDNARMNSYDFSKEFRMKVEDVMNIKVEMNGNTITSEVPFIGLFIERVFTDEDSSNGIEEKERMIVRDTSFSWKFLKLLAENDISKMAGNGKVLTICQEMYEKYKMKNQESSLTFASLMPKGEKVNVSPIVSNVNGSGIANGNLNSNVGVKMTPPLPLVTIHPIVQDKLQGNGQHEQMNYSNTIENDGKVNHISNSNVNGTSVINSAKKNEDDKYKEKEKEINKDKEKEKEHEKEKEREREHDRDRNKGRNDKSDRNNNSDKDLLHKKRSLDRSSDKNNNKKHKSNQ